MTRSFLVTFFSAVIFNALIVTAHAQDQNQIKTQTSEEMINSLYAAELLQDRERDQLRDQLRDADSDQDRDRIRDRMQQQLYTRAWEQGILLNEEPVYGGHLMTEQERMQYRKRLQNAANAEERERIRAEHRKEVQTRARANGEKLGDEPFYGQQMMTSRERKEYRKQIDGAATAAARERYREEHQQRMQVRAWERGLNPDYGPIYGGHMMTEQERAQYRRRLDSAGSAQAREQIREEHRQQMQKRAQMQKQKLGDEPIYGGALMTSRQRDHYRKMLRDADSAAHREQLMSSNREAMANHAWQHGIFPGREPVYGGHMMNEQERATYREKLRFAGNAAAREQVRAEHRTMIQNRARQYKLEPGTPAIFGQEMMSMNERQRYQKQLDSTGSSAAREQMRFQHMAQMQSRMQRKGMNPMSAGRMRSMNQERFEQQQRGMSPMDGWGGMHRGGGHGR